MTEVLYRLTLVTVANNALANFEEMEAAPPRLRIEIITVDMQKLESEMIGREVVIIVNQQSVACICYGYQRAPYAQQQGIVYMGPFEID